MSSHDPTEDFGAVPELGVSRLLLVVTGSTTATGVPFWLDWLRGSYPDLELRIVVTPGAERFVTRPGLALHSRGEVLGDRWEDDSRPVHVELQDWAEAIVVYPATLHYMARLALGLADTPSLLAAQCASVPIGVAPSVPPGAVEAAAFQAHWATLSERPNVVLGPPRPVLSAATGRRDGWGAAYLSDVLEQVEQCRRELAASAAHRAGPEAFLADRSTT